MSVVHPSYYNISCPLCGFELKVPSDRIGQLSTCEQCKEEITLDLPNSGLSNQPGYGRLSPATMAFISTQAGVSDKQIGIGYLLAIIIPLIGFVIGIYFLSKNQFGHGICCMIVSLIANALWFTAVVSVF
jgi:hypothetical protein